MITKPGFMPPLLDSSNPYHKMTIEKPFENIVGKGENAGNQHFLLFPQC